MNILVIGAGAIGCLVGGKLAQSGVAVTMVGRSHFADAVQANGLTLSDQQGNQRVDNLNVATSIRQAYNQFGSDFPLAILTVKSFDTAAAIDELRQAVEQSDSRPPVVLSLQNGVGNEEIIASVLGSTQVIAGTITTPVSITQPGIIHIDKARYNIGLSRWHPALSQKMFADLQHALKAVGFTVIVYPQAIGMKWTKLLMNMVGNASSAILDSTPEQVFSDKTLVDLEIEAWRETLRVMKAAQITPVNIGNYPFTILAPLIRYVPKPFIRGLLRKQIGGARGGKMPSLHIDLHSGKEKSEVHALNGAVVDMGRAVNMATPINRVLTDTLISMIGNSEKQDLWRGNTLRLIVSADEYRSRA